MGIPPRFSAVLIDSVLAVFLLGLCGCASFRPPTVAEAFGARPAPKAAVYPLPGGRRLATAEIGNPSGPLVLLVHGSPGSWRDFAHVLADPRLAERAWLVSVDRPGWGGSAEGGLETSLEAQARALRGVLEAHPGNRPVIVAGHSSGAPIAARLAMDAPEQVGGLVLVGGALDPALEKTEWYQKVSRWRLVRWMVPKMLRRADDELRPFKAELTAMAGRWGELRMPVTVLHGDDDDLVSPANADFVRRAAKNAPVTIERPPKVGHLIPWNRPELITAAILRHLDGMAKPAGQ